MNKMALLFKMCILYNSKFSLMSKCSGTNGVVKRVHCTVMVFNKEILLRVFINFFPLNSQYVVTCMSLLQVWNAVCFGI